MEISFLGSGGIALAADTVGDPSNPCVLLLPGFGQTKGAWASVAKALAAAGRYAVAVDLRGHGESDWSPDGRYGIGDLAEDITAVVRQLPSRPSIVGASIGGLAALAAIAEGHESLATSLVLVDAAPRMARIGLERGARLMTRDAQGFATVQEAAKVLSEHFSLFHLDVDLVDVRRHLRRSDDGRFRWHVDPAYNGFDVGSEERRAALRRFTAAAELLDIPALLVYGASSTKVDRYSVEAFRALVRQAEVLEIAGEGDVAIGRRNDAFDIAVLDFLERTDPRPGPRPQGGFEPRLLREALGCFASGVTVITTTDVDGAPMGVIVNSITSVSLDPPLVLFCVRRGLPIVAALRRQGAFAVNVLHIGQQQVAERFASSSVSGLDGFGETEWEVWERQVPIIFDAAANIECVIHEIVDGGDHVIVVGLVKRAHLDASRDPLLSFQGEYRRIHMFRGGK